MSSSTGSAPRATPVNPCVSRFDPKDLSWQQREWHPEEGAHQHHDYLSAGPNSSSLHRWRSSGGRHSREPRAERRHVVPINSTASVATTAAPQAIPIASGLCASRRLESRRTGRRARRVVRSAASTSSSPVVSRARGAARAPGKKCVTDAGNTTSAPTAATPSMTRSLSTTARITSATTVVNAKT